MDELVTGLMTWAPDQVEALVAMKERLFVIGLPILWAGLAAGIGLLLVAVILHVGNVGGWREPWLSLYFIGGLLALGFGIGLIYTLINLNQFRIAPATYVIKGLLGGN